MRKKPNYVTYIRQESLESSDEHQHFQEWVNVKTFEAEKEAVGEWKGRIRKGRRNKRGKEG